MKNLVVSVIVSFLTLVVSPPPAPTPVRLSKDGEVCGGFTRTPYKCDKGLECVNTHGPMVADAPGTCHAICKTKRDSWGNCVPHNCELWYDGCNNCEVDEDKKTLGCTKKMCLSVLGTPRCERYSTGKPTGDTFVKCDDFEKHLTKINEVCCAGNICTGGFPKTCSRECSSIVNVLFKDCSENLEKTGLSSQAGWKAFELACRVKGDDGISKKIPNNCASWYDGCNTCTVRKGKVNMCTIMMCIRQGPSYCKSYHTDDEKQHEKGRQCFDGKDNDHDGKADCDDPDCRIYGICRRRPGKGGETGRLCFDGKDNDHDGKADCDDPDCLKDPRVKRHCGHERGRQCFDGKDNDHDGKSDCNDPDCKRYGRCRRRGGKETGRLCFDGKDNDHDGKADCDDRDCMKDPRAAWKCRRTETGRECLDGKDNDHDGKVDCADPDCLKDKNSGCSGN